MAYSAAMRSLHFGRLVLAASVAVLASLPARPGRGGTPARSSAILEPSGGKMRGVCWEAVGPIDTDNLKPLRDLGVDWISQTPFGWSPSLSSPEIHTATDDRVEWGESDAGLVQTAVWARQMGIRTLLKPHLWVHHGEWVGDLEMHSEADWKLWFAAYESFIVHYAELAEANGMEALAIGTELRRSTSHADEWRRIIAHVRRVYHGSITYCANWHEEVQGIQFWGDLDFIGVQAYYPLGAAERPSMPEIRAAWRPIVGELASVSQRIGKPIVFTEIGYKSMAGMLRQPWEWSLRGEPDATLQCDAYRAMFESVWSQPWFGGTFIWKWHPYLRRPERAARDFTPQGKPALEVIRAWYTGMKVEAPAESGKATR
jgi:hypothetical protein